MRQRGESGHTKKYDSKNFVSVFHILSLMKVIFGKDNHNKYIYPCFYSK